MPLRRIDNDRAWTKFGTCRDPEHNPPGNIYLEPGTYEYTCPSCGAKKVFTVPAIMFLDKGKLT